ncbi:MAG: sugar ABC transporter permease [Planctomycetaceae bacterium]|nr:sugar ABC transporter permease [Planctomycetaceae bacterium]
MEEKKEGKRILFLFLIPTLIIFCGFFLPLAKVSSYTVFRGKELFELYWHWIEYAPPARGYGLLVSLFRVIPFLALPVMVVAGMGWKETPWFALVFSVICPIFTVGLALPGYTPLVAMANPAELGMPAEHPGLAGLISEGYMGLGFFLILLFSLLLAPYSVYHIATGGRGVLSVKVENAIYNAASRNIRQFMMIIALLGIWGIFYAITENGIFISSRNLSNLFLQSASTAVIAIGVVLILVTMNIDLSIGSVVGFIGAVAAVTQVDSPIAAWLTGTLNSMGIPLDYMAILGIIAALVVGWLIGTWHGWWIAYMGVPAFIVTLSSMMVFRGGLLYFTGGKSVANMYPWFKAIGMDYVSPSASVYLALAITAVYLVIEVHRRFVRQRYGFAVPSWPVQILKLALVCAAISVFFNIMIRYRGIPYAWLIVLVVMVIFTFIAEKTTFGRHLYAIGGNPEAAKLSGINIRWKIMSMYMLTGVVVAIGGIIYLSRIDSATANAGNGLEPDCIASAVIGGTSLMGGEGYIYGGVVGALVMGSLDNGMSLLNLDATWQYIAKGLVLLLAVWVDMATRRRGN